MTPLRTATAADPDRRPGSNLPAFRLHAAPGSEPVLRRLFLPVDPPQPGEEDTALAGYRRLLVARTPQVRSLAQKLEEPNPELGKFEKASEAFVRSLDEKRTDLSWKFLDIAIVNANALEERVRATGAKVEAAPSKLTGAEVDEIWKAIRADIPFAAELCRRLSGDMKYIPQVFDPTVADKARVGMGVIAEQLPLYLKDHILIDEQRALDSSGTVLQNKGNAAQADAIMTVTKSWTEKSRKQRLSALVHEASHGAAIGTNDLGYLGTWSFSGLEPAQQLKNAPHYEAVAEMALGLRETTEKPLESNVSETYQPMLRKLLGRSDTLLTKRRLRTGHVIQALNVSRAAKKPVEPTERIDPAVVGGALSLPYAPRQGRPGMTVATNLDIELFGLFRGWLESIHRVLTNIKRLDISKEGAFILSDDRSVLTVPYQWARAGDEDVRAFLERLARSLPVVAQWHPDALVTAMNSLPTE